MTDDVTGKRTASRSDASEQVIGELVRQLERAKFHRLLRHLLDDPATSGDAIREPAAAIGTPGAELLVKHLARRSGHGYDRATWVFRPIHLPVNAWGADALTAQLDRMVDAAFADLARNPAVLDRFGPEFAFAGREDLEGWGPAGDRFLYTFTNVPHDIDDGPVSASVQRWIEMWQRHLPGVPRPSFGLGSPETLAKNSADETLDLLKRLLAEPSGYVAVAREGRIAFAPFTEHGSFVAAGLAGREGAGLATATATLRSGLTMPIVAAFEDLLNQRGTKERDIQAFLEEQPAILGGLDAHMVEARPRVSLTDSAGTRLVPDFMARLDDARAWKLLELKGPDDSVLVRRGGALKPSAKVAAAIAQLLGYRDFFHEPENRRRLAPLLGAAPFQPLLTVVIGRGEPGRRWSWRGGPGLPEASIVTYDHLLEQARRAVAEP